MEPVLGLEGGASERPNLRDILDSFERKLIAAVLRAAGGNQKRAAEALGVLPTTLQEKLKRFGLVHPRPGRRVRGGERTSTRSDSIPGLDGGRKTPQEDVHK